MAGKNHMNGELLYTRNPRHFRIIWGLVYLALFASLLVGLYVAATRIRTHTLPVGEIQLSVPYSRYVAGETVTFTIKNNFNSSIYVMNNCPAEPLNVYRKEGGTWVHIHDQSSTDACPDEQRQVNVPAHSTINGSFAAWPHLFDQPGKYRVVAYVENYNALPYQEFEVIAKPAPAVKQIIPAPSVPASNTITQPGGGTVNQRSPTTDTERNDN